MIDGVAKIVDGDSQPSRFPKQLADETPRLGDAIIRAAFRGQVEDEGPGTLARSNEPFGFELAVGLNDGRRIDAKLGRQLSHRRQGGARLELARRDCNSKSRRDLRV